MTEAACVFACQFAFILTLGMQTQNVIGRHYAAAMGSSLLLGMMGLYLTGVIAKAAVLGGSWVTTIAYLVAGPLAIATSMWLHPKLAKGKPNGRHE